MHYIRVRMFPVPVAPGKERDAYALARAGRIGFWGPGQGAMEAGNAGRP